MWLFLIGLFGFVVLDAKASEPDPELVCCLNNYWHDCAVITFFDPDEGITNQIVIEGIKVDCPYI